MEKKLKILVLEHKLFRKMSIISGLKNTESFFSGLSDYCEIIFYRIENFEEIDFSYIDSLSPDYIFINLELPQLFFLRAQNKINYPFIIILHSVFYPPIVRQLLTISPFISKRDIVLIGSEFAKASVRKIIKTSQIYVVPFIVDIEKIRSYLKKSKTPFRPTITYLGRLDEDKGVIFLIKSLPLIKRVYENVNLKIIGPLADDRRHDKPLGSQYKRMALLAKKLGVENNVVFKGVLEGKEKFLELENSDIFVNPSVAPEETFGVVNIEAFACSVPSILSKIPPFLELGQDREHCRFVDISWKDNKPTILEKELANACIELLDNKNERERIKINASKQAQKYDGKRIMSLLAKLLKNNIKARSLSNQAFYEKILNKKLSDLQTYYNSDFLEINKLGSILYKDIKERYVSNHLRDIPLNFDYFYDFIKNYKTVK